jgi:hypothetical protein
MIFTPIYPQHTTSALDEMRIGACTAFIWMLVIAPHHPIITTSKPFWIRTPHVGYALCTQIGRRFLADEHHAIYSLIHNDPRFPRYVAVTLDDTTLPHDVTWLVPAIYTDPNLTITYLG